MRSWIFEPWIIERESSLLSKVKTQQTLKRRPIIKSQSQKLIVYSSISAQQQKIELKEPGFYFGFVRKQNQDELYSRLLQNKQIQKQRLDYKPKNRVLTGQERSYNQNYIQIKRIASVSQTQAIKSQDKQKIKQILSKEDQFNNQLTKNYFFKQVYKKQEKQKEKKQLAISQVFVIKDDKSKNPNFMLKKCQFKKSNRNQTMINKYSALQENILFAQKIK